MKPDSEIPVTTPETLKGVAKAIADETIDRFHILAESFEFYNNPPASKLFRELVIREKARIEDLEELPAPKGFFWGEGETDTLVHYLMWPYHAVGLALACSERARDYYFRLAKEPALKTLADELITREENHIRFLRQWQKTLPVPPADWDEDPDPPNYDDT